MQQSLKAYFSEYEPEAGCDEAGRGCLAGPVFAAAVILPRIPHPALSEGLNDSKKLSHAERLRLREIIQQHALAVGVAMVNNESIDQVNILNASILAMHLALGNLSLRPGMILVDGNRFKIFENIPHACIVRGDCSYLSIAAASIMAKTSRDEYMASIHHEYPQYGWIQNKGYPTRQHKSAIASFGLSPYHRLSFRQVSQLRLNFQVTGGENN